MAKPNYNSKKRQKELARQEKQELKRQRRIGRKTDEPEIPPDPDSDQIEPSETS